MVQPCFATEVRELARPTPGKKVLKERKALLISCDVSSLVVDALCKQAVGENAAVACFYFGFTTPKEQYPAVVLGSVLEQVVHGLDEIPGKIVETFRDRRKVAGSQRLVLSEIVELLRGILSTRRVFICIDALDECQPRHRVKLLDSLNKIILNSQAARIFLTGSSDIRSEVDKHLAKAVTLSITPTEVDIISFLQAKLEEDTIPDEMDENLKKEIINNIPQNVSEM